MIKVTVRAIILLFLYLFLSIIPNSSTLYPAFAQSSGSCSTTGTAIATGLVTSPTLGQDLVTSSGVCVIDPKAAFAPYKVPSYDDLKSLYFDQYKGPSTDKFTKNGGMGEGELHGHLTSGKKLVYVTEHVDINGTISGTNTGVVFVDSKLNLTPPLTQFIYGDGNSGIVFVVKGNVNIDPAITRIDAVIISEGTICTAADFTDPANPTCPAINVANSLQLVINGSLISLNENAPIKFRRSLAINTIPAEKINHDVKYLVILRNLMSDTFQRWSEIQ